MPTRNQRLPVLSKKSLKHLFAINACPPDKRGFESLRPSKLKASRKEIRRYLSLSPFLGGRLAHTSSDTSSERCRACLDTQNTTIALPLTSTSIELPMSPEIAGEFPRPQLFDWAQARLRPWTNSRCSHAFAVCCLAASRLDQAACQVGTPSDLEGPSKIAIGQRPWYLLISTRRHEKA